MTKCPNCGKDGVGSGSCLACEAKFVLRKREYTTDDLKRVQAKKQGVTLEVYNRILDGYKEAARWEQKAYKVAIHAARMRRALRGLLREEDLLTTSLAADNGEHCVTDKDTAAANAEEARVAAAFAVAKEVAGD